MPVNIQICKLLMPLTIITSAANAQVTSRKQTLPLDKHGTCAVVIHSPLGSAFIIDSRVTETRGNTVVAQYPGCKVLLARPTLLLAGVGLTDTTGNAGHWNSLDEASRALKTLTSDPSENELNRWGLAWVASLTQHFRQEEPRLAPGIVSELIIVSNVQGKPYFGRVTVVWDGKVFSWTIFGGAKDEETPNVHYSGACRTFVVHHDTTGITLQPDWPSTPAEQQRLDYWGNRKNSAKNITDLADAAYGLESMLTDKDERLEGEHAVIAAPFASAQLSKDAKEWTTDFNKECDSVPVVPK